MNKNYAVSMFDQDGFPFLKSESVLVKQEEINNHTFLVLSDLEGAKVARLELEPNQPRFIQTSALPFTTYKLKNNFTINIKKNK